MRYSCICSESKKPLKDRNWKIESYQPYKCYGPYCSSYDGRRLLRITCNSCGAHWQNKSKTSKYWNIINETPFGGGRKNESGDTL